MSKKHQDKREKNLLSELISNKIRLPSDSSGSGFCAELRGRSLLYLNGCRRILKYSSEEMIIAARGFEVKVLGSGLICSFFYGGTIAIEGEICGLSIPRREETA